MSALRGPMGNTPIGSSIERGILVMFCGLSVWAGSPIGARAQSSGPPTAPSFTPNPSTPLPPPSAATHVVADSILTAPANPLPTPLLMAGFAVPTAKLDWQALHLLRACQSQFDHAVQLATRGELAHASNRRLGVPSATPASPFAPLPDSTIAIGQQCLARIGDPIVLPPVALPLLLRYAVGINNDTLAQNVVARQLAIAGTGVRDRGRVLEAAIKVLQHNQWNDQAELHRTPAHDSLALRYAAQLDTMQPVRQVLASRLRVMETMREITAPAVWNVDEEIAWAQANRRLAMSVPLRTVPLADTASVHGGYSRLLIVWLAYLKTPTHANLATYLTVRDSIRGWAADSLLNHPAPSMTADYWFNVPAGMSSPPALPAPKTVTLLMFADSLSAEQAARLQQFHMQYPALQIVLVSMTKGNGGADAPSSEQLAQQAAQIAAHFTEAVHWPVLTGVLNTKYHTETNATDIPMALPFLDHFHLDPREYADRMFLIDAEGWLVENRPITIWNGHLLQQLLAR